MYHLQARLASSDLGRLRQIEKEVLAVAKNMETRIVKECEQCEQELIIQLGDLGTDHCPSCHKPW